VEFQILQTLIAQAESAPAGDGTPPGMGQGCMQMMILILPMILIFYFLIIRPQQKQQKRHRDLVGGLKKGDKVITNAGIFGTVTGLVDNAVTLEVSKNVHIKVLKSYVAGLQPEPGEKGVEGPVVPGNKK